VHRTSLLVLVLAVAATACSDTGGEECPGAPVADFAFSGARIPSGDPGLLGLDPVPAVPDCTAAVGPPPYPEVLPGFRATLAADPSTQAAALCRPAKAILFGQRSGTRYVVESGTGGAVLAACSPSCTAALRLVVAGDVVAGPGGEPASFQGALVEVMSWVDGDCGTCLPEPARACAARYALQGTL
jgi:hypothetical protein